MRTRYLCALLLVLALLNGAPPVRADPSACNASYFQLFHSQPETLALMVDATGTSLDNLGKWDQCRDLGSHVAHFCTVRFAIPVAIPTHYVGVCIPAQCDGTDIANLTRVLINAAGQYDSIPSVAKLLAWYQELLVYEEHAQQYEFSCPADTPSVLTDKGGLAVVIVTFLLFSLVVVGTSLDGYDSSWWPEQERSSNIVAPAGGIQDEAEVKPLLRREPIHRSKLFQFFIAFSVARNFKSLIGPSPPSLAFLNGMRVISIAWVILGHSLDYMNYAGALNYAHVITKDVKHAAAQVFPGAEFSVDSFFWLSGFLVTYLTVQELKTKKRVNWFLYYFHRFWRLSPAYFYALFFYTSVSIYLSDGPLWPKYVNQVQSTCDKYWWTNIAYINNFVPSVWNGQCFLWGWYLAVDMQLYIVAPIFFILYYKKRVLGWALVLAMIVFSTLLNGVYAHVHHLVWNATDPHVFMSLVYGKPYTRAAPWLLGIACAFLYLEKRQLTRPVVYVGWVISGAVMLLCVYGPTGQFSGGSSELDPPKDTWGAGRNFMYFTFSKLGWSLALSFIMYSMAMGWGGFVRRFLGAPLWNPLARLTYSTYLFHPIILFVFYYSHLQYLSYDPYFISIIYVGIVFISFGAAAVMFMLLERPMTSMEKLFLHKKH